MRSGPMSTCRTATAHCYRARFELTPRRYSRRSRGHPVLEGDEWRKLLNSIPTTTLRDLRDRALIATLTYSFARITAALKMKVEDLRPRGAGWTVRLHEK